MIRVYAGQHAVDRTSIRSQMLYPGPMAVQDRAAALDAGEDAAPPTVTTSKGCERGGPWYIRARTRSFGLEVVLSWLR
jgi:hypothetical protein